MYHPSKPFTKPPKGFLKINNLEEQEAKDQRILDNMDNCVRCNAYERIEALGAVLTHFACKSCRNDVQEWGFKGNGEAIPYTVAEMEYQTPEVRIPDGKGGYLPVNGR